MKLTLVHRDLIGNGLVDSLVEERVQALAALLYIEEAIVHLERVREASPPYRVSLHLVVPGPDVKAEGCDHTLLVALDKAIRLVHLELRRRQLAKGARRRDHRQKPAYAGAGRGSR